MKDVAMKASVETTDLIAVVINTPKSYHYYVVKNIEGVYKLKEEIKTELFGKEIKSEKDILLTEDRKEILAKLVEINSQNSFKAFIFPKDSTFDTKEKVFLKILLSGNIKKAPEVRKVIDNVLRNKIFTIAKPILEERAVEILEKKGISVEKPLKLREEDLQELAMDIEEEFWKTHSREDIEQPLALFISQKIVSVNQDVKDLIDYKEVMDKYQKQINIMLDVATMDYEEEIRKMIKSVPVERVTEMIENALNENLEDIQEKQERSGKFRKKNMN